ncbi:MAG: sensory rhodopsin transducer [Candidatus Eremiobacteraeota bacterium]|nr:sensory rhodopsin transducer [Candidatus Eremiobacteraeota bacterium]
MNNPPGKKLWALAEGYIPEWSHGPKPELESHGTICVLNAGDQEAQLELTIYFADREPAGPYQMKVPARRTHHIRFNELRDPEAIPKGKDFASVLSSQVPVVVQHTRIDTRQAEAALMSTIGYSQ